MRMLQSILLATDLRPASEAAVEAAARLGSVFGSTVSVLHVLEAVPGWPEELHGEREQAAGPLRALEGRLVAARAYVAERVVAVGPPAEVILRKAAEMDADLIVLGAGDRSRTEASPVGPTAEAVVQHTLAPVLVVRPCEPLLRFEKILCPVDHSPVSARALRNAIRLARAFGSRLTVLSVVPSVSWFSAAVETGVFTGVAAEHARLWRAEFDWFLQRMEEGTACWDREIRSGRPHEEILQACHEHQADLLVMGSTGRSGLSRVLMGSTSRRLLRDLPCSLLMVKTEDVIEELFEDDLRHIQLLLAEGRQLLAGKCHAMAAGKFRQVLTHNPFDVTALEGLAEAEMLQGHTEEAERYRRRIRRLQEGLAAVD